MPIWFFYLTPFSMALVMVVGIELISMVGLYLFRRWITPQILMHEGVNDAISGIVQAIGVFYGVTVGLLAVGVWNTWSTSADLVSREAAAIGALYRDISSFQEPARTRLRQGLRNYTVSIIQVEWPSQRRGQLPNSETPLLGAFHDALMDYEPVTEGQKARYVETLVACNHVLQQRALRLDAVGAGLSQTMWWVIWSGAAISIGVAYFFHLKDWKLHGSLVALMAGFLGLVLFIIVVNDRPFRGSTTINSDSFQLILDTTMKGP